MIKKLISVVLFLQINVYLAQSQIVKYSNEFLSIGVGARQLGMGGASVAGTTGVYSTYWNPAALITIKDDAQVGAMHNENFGGISKYDYLGFSTIDKSGSALGFSIIRNGVDGIPNTLDLIDEDGNVRYDRVSSFSVNDYAFFISAARLINESGLAVGGNVKIIRRIVGKFASAWGLGIDIATQYRNNNWILGATLRDATGTFNAWKFNTETFKETFLITENEIPKNSLEVTMPKLLLGVARSFIIKTKSVITAEINADCTFDGKRNTVIKSDIVSVDPKVGVEYSYNSRFSIRAGVNNMQQISDISNKKRFDIQPNVGAGIAYKHFTLDYALSVIGDKTSSLYSNIFSLSYSFNKN